MGQVINLNNKIELEYKSHSMREEKPKLNYTKQFNKKVLLFITSSMLLFTQCSKVEIEEERISRILTGEKKLVWNIHSNYWNEYSKSYDKTVYLCEFNKSGYGFYIQHLSNIIKFSSSDSTWKLIDKDNIRFNYDTFKILSYNDTIFKLKYGEDTFFLIKNKKQSEYSYLKSRWYVTKRAKQILERELGNVSDWELLY